MWKRAGQEDSRGWWGYAVQKGCKNTHSTGSSNPLAQDPLDQQTFAAGKRVADAAALRAAAAGASFACVLLTC